MNLPLQVYTIHFWIHVHRQLLEKRNHFGKARFRHKKEGTPSDVHQYPDYQTYLNQHANNMSNIPSPKNGLSEENNTKCQTVTCLEIQTFYLYVKHNLLNDMNTCT